MTDEGDIGFHVYYKEDGEKVDVVPYERIDSHLSIEEGEIVCHPGHTCTYYII